MEPESCVGPRWVESRPENCLGSVKVPLLPQLGQLRSARPLVGAWPFFSSYASSRWSARHRLWQEVHSVSGSVKVATWPEATHTSGARITDESIPTTSSREVTM